MKPRSNNTHLQRASSFNLQTALLAAVPDTLRRLVQAAYVSHGGAEFMKLSDWRDLELELKRRLENENRQPH
jgi:hypothetical protein